MYLPLNHGYAAVEMAARHWRSRPWYGVFISPASVDLR
jgi:hypothetical protein